MNSNIQGIRSFRLDKNNFMTINIHFNTVRIPSEEFIFLCVQEHVARSKVTKR